MCEMYILICDFVIDTAISITYFAKLIFLDSQRKYHSILLLVLNFNHDRLHIFRPHQLWGPLIELLSP